MQATEPRSEGATRRSFHIAAIYGIWTAIAVALGIPALIYLFFPPKARKEEEWVEIGDVTRLAPNTPVEMVGLYWHFVDLVWIYLFPLLYLISHHHNG